MKTYQIKYGNKTVKARGDTAFDAICNYGNRSFFGNFVFYNPLLKMCDADTYGKVWARASAKKDGDNITVEAEVQS
jgi:hypothetical protein